MYAFASSAKFSEISNFSILFTVLFLLIYLLSIYKNVFNKLQSELLFLFGILGTK